MPGRKPELGRRSTHVAISTSEKALVQERHKESLQGQLFYKLGAVLMFHEGKRKKKTHR